MPEKFNREQLIELVTKIIDSEGTEDEINEWIALANDSVPHPSISDLIFYTEDEKTPEQIVTKALAYRAIQL